jgi:hypothetical protein
LGDAVQAMMFFPGGAWDLELEVPDVLSWLPTLQKLPKSSATTHAIVGITRLSGEITALLLMVSDDEDEDDHLGSITNCSACSVIAVSWPSVRALALLANPATANVARLRKSKDLLWRREGDCVG